MAEIAPTLNGTELKLLTALAAIAEKQNAQTVKISARELAATTKVALSSVHLAADALTARGILTRIKGPSTSPGTYLLNFLLTARMGDPKIGSPPNSTWSENRITPTLFSDHPDPIFGSPPTGNKGLIASPERVDIKRSIEPIDRLLKAKAADFDAELLTAARRWLYTYVCKLGKEPHEHPPVRPPLANCPLD